MSSQTSQIPTETVLQSQVLGPDNQVLATGQAVLKGDLSGTFQSDDPEPPDRFEHPVTSVRMATYPEFPVYRDKNGDIYHTYSSYSRGIDLMNTTYNFLDLTAKGRDENPDATQDWVRYHDEYKPTN